MEGQILICPKCGSKVECIFHGDQGPVGDGWAHKFTGRHKCTNPVCDYKKDWRKDFDLFDLDIKRYSGGPHCPLCIEEK